MAQAPKTSRVRVGVRIRPLTSQEIHQGGKPSLNVSPPSVGIGERRFTYDAVFDSNVSQLELYETVSTPLITSFVDGYNATIMAYGQTGSGKTFTMGSESHAEPDTSSHGGLIPRFMSDFFQTLQNKKEESDTGKEGSPALLEFKMTSSFLEVYGEEIFDLLDEGRKALPLREDSNGGVVIAGLTSRPVSSVSEALQVLHEGTMNRTTAATLMNLTSSRSHAVFTIYLTQIIRSDSCSEVDLSTTSQFSFVDLAGSERMKKTGAEGERAREGIKINQGLLALGNVINALADDERLANDKKVHVPYRQSKLTRLLQDSLGGNSQTLFLACVSPSDTNASETLSTLHYANRARNIRNAPTKNVDATAAELQRLHAVTHVLQSELVKQRFSRNDGDKEAETIGYVDDALLKRKDVEEYLQMILRVAGEMQGQGAVVKFSANAVNAPPSSKHFPQSPITFRPESVMDRQTPTNKGNVVDSTPNRSVVDRFDDSFLVDANPVEDMAILDQLLELQHHDHEYDKEKKKDDEQLKDMVGELERQESLLLQLKESLKVYQNMKDKYEALMGEVQQLELEKTELADQLEKATSDPSAGCSAAIKRKLEMVEMSLSRAKSETKKHREKYRKAEEEAKKCRALERKISDLKQAKVALIKKQKEAASRYREITENKTKELLALKRKERVTGQKMTKLETEIQHHKSNLGKRKVYCEKLSSKLKQTEAHLMKLLSMRRKELNVRTSLGGAANNRRKTTGFSASNSDFIDQPNGGQVASSDDIKSMRFILFKMVGDKVNQASLKQEYDDQIALYSRIVRQLMVEMKELEEAKTKPESPESREAIFEKEESIADLELKLELVSSELEDVRSKLPNHDHSLQLDGDEAAKKLMASMSAPQLRALLLETFTKFADSEMERKVAQKAIERKDSALRSFENEVEALNNRIAALSKDVSIRRSIATQGANPVLLTNLQNENGLLRSEIDDLKSKLEANTFQTHNLKNDTREAKTALAKTQELLTVAEASTADHSKYETAKQTLQKLQQFWDDLGIDFMLREKARKEIETCLQDTCSRKLQEINEFHANTMQEIANLTKRVNTMQVALRMSSPIVGHNDAGSLLAVLQALRSEVQNLEPQFKYANERRNNILEAATSLSKSMGFHVSQLSHNLQELIQQGRSSFEVSEGTKNGSGSDVVAGIDESVPDGLGDRETIGGLVDIPEGSNSDNSVEPDAVSGKDIVYRLDEPFLSSCERDVTSLRLKKSEILVRNQEMQQHASDLAKEMHLSASDVLMLVVKCEEEHSDGIPEWWDNGVANEVIRALSNAGVPPGVTESHTQHLTLVCKVLVQLSGGRRALSLALRGIVERAQKTLLDIVGREFDASEAYASFHDALFRLPAVSKELIEACIAEMDALAIGVEAMTQSEIEALSVVWEAMNISSADRRGFWGEVEESETSMDVKVSPFQEAARLCSEDIEAWVHEAVDAAVKGNQLLERRLFKLEKIHEEVEKLRSRQDSKSRIISLDSEVRILNANLLDFEDLQCSKQRLLSKKSGGSTLLKEERFRKQMQGKFVSKLEQLASLLRSWKKDEKVDFDATLLSEDVRALLNNPNKMEAWVEQRTKFMPLRTIQSKTPIRKGPVDNTPAGKSDSRLVRSSRHKSNITPPRTRSSRAMRPGRGAMRAPQLQTQPSTGRSRVPTPTRPSNKRKPDEKAKLVVKSSKVQRTLASKSPVDQIISSPSNRRANPLLPFGHVLSELASPPGKENS